MKKQHGVILAVFVVSLLLAGCDTLLGDLSSLAGEWTVNVVWNDSSESSWTWTLRANHTFTDSLGNVGTWNTSGIIDFSLIEAGLTEYSFIGIIRPGRINLAGNVFYHEGGQAGIFYTFKH